MFSCSGHCSCCCFSPGWKAQQGPNSESPIKLNVGFFVLWESHLYVGRTTTGCFLNLFLELELLRFLKQAKSKWNIPIPSYSYTSSILIKKTCVSCDLYFHNPSPSLPSPPKKRHIRPGGVLVLLPWIFLDFSGVGDLSRDQGGRKQLVDFTNLVVSTCFCVWSYLEWFSKIFLFGAGIFTSNFFDVEDLT